ncbi:MAG: TolC family protein [Akkermansiaceae bacterium]|jgi:cobalt-zinc-cadmium efflux system outer membrane protein|nr:TolC family protein [Akkermansiaceae bacterium]
MKIPPFLILLGCSILPALAEPGVVVTLDSVGDRVRAGNPTLAAARLTIDEAVGQMKQSGRLENPDFDVELRHNDRFTEKGVEISLSQRFPVTRRLVLEKQLGTTLVQAAENEVREVENTLIGDARAALVRVLAIRARAALLDEQSALSSELAEFIDASAKKGEASPLDAGQAKIESARLIARRRQLAAEEQQAIGELKPLLGMATGELLHVSGGLPALDVPDGSDASQRPAEEIARLAVIAAEQQAAIEHARRYGDLTAGVFVGAERFTDAPEPADKEAIIGVRFSVPLPFWDKNDGNIEAAEARAARRRKEAFALRQGILLEAEAARSEMLEWAELAVEIGDELLPQSKAQTTLTEDAWRKGQGDLITVLRAREQHLELAASRLDALLEFHLARVRYQTALGNP